MSENANSGVFFENMYFERYTSRFRKLNFYVLDQKQWFIVNIEGFLPFGSNFEWFWYTNTVIVCYVWIEMHEVVSETSYNSIL